MSAPPLNYSLWYYRTLTLVFCALHASQAAITVVLFDCCTVVGGAFGGSSDGRGNRRRCVDISMFTVTYSWGGGLEFLYSTYKWKLYRKVQPACKLRHVYEALITLRLVDQ